MLDATAALINHWPKHEIPDDSHELAFQYFHGVFHLLRYDNLKAAVKKILRGYQREETARFIAFRSHWRFASEFCSPYEAHEKGGIESEAGYFRRNHWVPIPKARNLEELNAQLLAAQRGALCFQFILHEPEAGQDHRVPQRLAR